MNFTPGIIKDLGVGVVNGQVIAYPQCPHRLRVTWDRGITREIFKCSNEVLPYFWYLLFPDIYPPAEPYLLKNGEMAATTKRVHHAVDFLSEKYFCSPNWFIPYPVPYGVHGIDTRAFVVDGTTAVNVWPVESAWRKGGELTTSDPGILKLSDKCFNHPAFVLKNEMLMQKHFCPDLTHYRIHVIGLDKKVGSPEEEHRILEFEYELFMEEAFDTMMKKVIAVYNKMEDSGWVKEEGRFRCRFCPITDCFHNIKASPLVYKKKYGFRR